MYLWEYFSIEGVHVAVEVVTDFFSEEKSEIVVAFGGKEGDERGKWIRKHYIVGGAVVVVADDKS